MARIILKKGKGESLKRFHPWVFSGAVQQIDEAVSEGDVVEVYSKEGEFLGCGHYQIGSITVRILSFTEKKITEDFWYTSLLHAYKEREALGLVQERSKIAGEGSVADENRILAEQRGESAAVHNRSFTNAYRLVHGEGDFLPGLIIDIYDTTAVMQAHSAGMFLAREAITNALKRVYGNRLTAVYDKSAATAPFKAGLDLQDGYLWQSDCASEGASLNQVIYENGNRFYVNWIEGQKTGFFLDQRDNRELVKKYAAGKHVLNLFCYTGGFSIYALSGGALCVDSVDSSKKAIELVRENVVLNGFTDASTSPESKSNISLKGNGSEDCSALLNGRSGAELCRHEAFCEDAIEFMRHCQSNKYDLIIVDPPAFAKHRGSLDNALRAYKKLNALAIEKVAAGGLIFTYSCSQVVDKRDFALAVFSAAAQTGRKVRILHRLTQPADHPVNIYHPEGEYLKGLVLFVE